MSRQSEARTALVEHFTAKKCERGCENPDCEFGRFYFVNRPWNLHWDHLGIDAKDGNIADMIQKLRPLAVIEAEAMKCRVLCVVCHSDHSHYQRMGEV